MVAIAPGMFLAHSVVPSSGSTAMSTCGPALSPTFSPMNSIGASSRSPSPITMVPSIGSLLSSRRIASTAAWSAAFSLPWPRSRAADTAARSVTRTISSVRMRSSSNCGGTEIWVDIGALPSSIQARHPALPTIPVTRALQKLSRNWSVLELSWNRALILLDPYHLRPSADHLVALDRLQGAVNCVLMRGVGDQQHGHRRTFPFRLTSVNSTIGMALHDRFNRNLLLGKPCCNGRGGSGVVARHQADVIAALMPFHRRLLGRAQAIDRTPEWVDAHAACDVGDIGDHGGCGCGPARAGTNQRDRRNALAIDRDRVRHTHHLRDRRRFRHHGRVHALLDALCRAYRDAKQLDAVAEVRGGAQILGRDGGNTFDMDRAFRNLRAEGEAREDGELLRGIVAIDVEGRIGFGIAETLRVLQAFGE